jgi:endonuclease III
MSDKLIVAVDTHLSRIRGKLEITPDDGRRQSAVSEHGYWLKRDAAAAQ